MHAKYASQVRALDAQLRTESKDAKAARQRGDTAAFRSIHSNIATQRAQLVQSERSDLRNALSAQNQARFDANVQAMQSRASRKGLHPGLKKP